MSYHLNQDDTTEKRENFFTLPIDDGSCVCYNNNIRGDKIKAEREKKMLKMPISRRSPKKHKVYEANIQKQ